MLRVVSDPSQSTGRGTGQTYAVDVLILDGFNLTELAEIVDCIEILKSVGNPVQVALSLVSPQGGTVRGSNPCFQVNTQKADGFPGAGVVILIGTPRAQELSAQLAHLWTQTRRSGRHVIVLSEAVSALKQRGCFGDEVVCVHWTDPILQDGRWSDQVCETTIFHMAESHTTGAGHSSAVHAVLSLIERDFGLETVNRTAEHLLLGDIRSTSAYQQYSVQDRYLVDDPRVVEMLEIMESEIEDKVSIPDIARRLGISTRQLERLCRRHLGTPPLRTLETMRMRKSRWMVERTAAPITEVALACGFSSPSLFSRCFKRHFGMKPMDIRRASLSSNRSGAQHILDMTPADAAAPKKAATG
jgi:transcriptional regulator GlxA family with amidase domain